LSCPGLWRGTFLGGPRPSGRAADGRDANSYANVAWVFGLHDRPWPERPVFGKVRYMNAKGLEQKFDMAAYLRDR
jgi:deoxyribodipyrimidine photolyase